MLEDDYIGMQEIGLIVEVCKGAPTINSLQCRYTKNGMPLY
jgi:hypothetical protein